MRLLCELMIKLPLSFKTVQLWLPKIRALLSASVVLILALATSLAISAVIKLIQQDADQWRVGQVLLMRLDKRVYQLNALEAQTSNDSSLAHINQSSLDNLNSEAQEYLDQLTQARKDRNALPEIRYNLARYQTALTEEFRLLDAGKAPEARLVHQEKVRPAFEKLTDAIGDANNNYASQAVFAGQVADVGTTTVLLITALGLSLLVRRFERVRRQGAQLTTEREMLRQSEERFRALIRNASDVIAILTPEGQIRYLSSAAQHLWGYAPEDLEGTCVFALMPPEEGARPQTLMEQAIESPEGGLTTEMRVQYADQSWHLSEIILTNLLSEPGIEGVVLTCRDISERKAFEEQLSHQAFHDALTGLPNRALFMERLLHAQARARRQQTCVGVVFLDLDNFKVINDSLGHEAGDHLLLTVAQRLSDCIRPGDTVARLGGDEFTVLFEDLADNDHIMGLAERIVQVMDTPVTVSGREVFTTVSLGIALSVGDDRSAEDLLRDADTAMYQAKTNGKARSVVFDRSMNADAVERLELEIDMRRALDREEFCVYYQPIVCLETGRINEVEALVRWQHPERGLVAPLKFIPLAEQTGLIVPLGRWVLREACRQMHEWQRQYPEEPPMMVSVNLSARQLQQPTLLEEVIEILKETSLSPHLLKLEITESVMMLDSETTIPRLHQLKALGIHLAVDDFGTGYSSMSYLSSLPIDTLKIDRAFVSNMGRNPEDLAIVRAIVSLAKTLNLRITSEGIETIEQLEQLRALGSDQGQGYYFDRPLPADQFRARLAARSAMPYAPEDALVISLYAAV